MKFAFIARKTGRYPIAWMCRRLGVSTSGYYAWRGRPPSTRAVQDAQLSLCIRAIHRRYRGRYGRPRIYDELGDQGHRVGVRRVGRLMREQGLFGRMPKRFKKTTHSAHDLGYADNLVQQRFTASEPNRLWVSDISYVRTWQGWLYVAVILDAFSRRVVGYAVDDHMRTELALGALQMRSGPGVQRATWCTIRTAGRSTRAVPTRTRSRRTAPPAR